MILGVIANLAAVIYLVAAFMKECICFKVIGIILVVNGKYFFKYFINLFFILFELPCLFSNLFFFSEKAFVFQ